MEAVFDRIKLYLSNLLVLFRAFFCWWTAFLNLGVNQNFSIFRFLAVEAVFPSSGNGFSIECFIPASGNGFYVQCSFIRADFLAVETIIHIKVMPFFYRITSLLLLETIFYVFFSFLISCHRKQFFCVVEKYLFKEDFIQSFTQQCFH